MWNSMNQEQFEDQARELGFSDALIQGIVAEVEKYQGSVVPVTWEAYLTLPPIEMDD